VKNVVGLEILEVLDEMKSGKDERANLSLTLHFVVFDTQRAIFDLIKSNHFGTSSALLRVLFETHVKAEWLQHFRYQLNTAEAPYCRRLIAAL